MELVDVLTIFLLIFPAKIVYVELYASSYV